MVTATAGDGSEVQFGALMYFDGVEDVIRKPSHIQDHLQCYLFHYCRGWAAKLYYSESNYR